MVEHGMLQTASWFQHDKFVQTSFDFWILKDMIMSFGLGLGIFFSIEPRSFWKTVHGKSEGGKDLSSKSLENHSTNLVIAEREKRWTSGKRQHCMGDGYIWILWLLPPMIPEVTYPPKKMFGKLNTQSPIQTHHKQPRSTVSIDYLWCWMLNQQNTKAFFRPYLQVFQDYCMDQHQQSEAQEAINGTWAMKIYEESVDWCKGW